MCPTIFYSFERRRACNDRALEDYNNYINPIQAAALAHNPPAARHKLPKALPRSSIAPAGVLYSPKKTATNPLGALYKLPTGPKPALSPVGILHTFAQVTTCHTERLLPGNLSGFGISPTNPQKCISSPSRVLHYAQTVPHFHTRCPELKETNSKCNFKVFTTRPPKVLYTPCHILHKPCAHSPEILH